MSSRDGRVLNNGGSRNACPSGKLAHSTRADAKRHALKHRLSYGDHVRPYRCDHCQLWHVGHLPRVVLDGVTTADEHYGRTAP